MKFSPLLLLAIAGPSTVPGDEPPPGPPWQLTYGEAREHALRTGQPIFTYFTKTYCPHCVPVDEMLSRKELEPLYDKVTWLFVSRNFKGDTKDREALRSHDRFGISSWPQLVIFDPRTDEVLAEPPRGLEGFAATLERAAKQHAFRPTRREAAAAARDASLTEGDDRPIRPRFEDEDARTRAIALEDATLAITEESGGSRAPAIPAGEVLERLLDPDEDIVVRVRALRYLRAVAPERVAENATELLEVPNDPLRYECLEVLGKQANPDLSTQLATIFQGAGSSVPSRNPNVLRMHAARALATSGTAGAVDALRPIALEANPLNSTTRVVVEALGAIASRAKPPERREIQALLLESLPAGGDDPRWGDDAHERMLRITRAHAEVIRGALILASGREDLPPVPDTWDTASRPAYVAQLEKALR